MASAPPWFNNAKIGRCLRAIRFKLLFEIIIRLRVHENTSSERERDFFQIGKSILRIVENRGQEYREIFFESVVHFNQLFLQHYGVGTQSAAVQYAICNLTCYVIDSFGKFNANICRKKISHNRIKTLNVKEMLH